MTFEAFEPSEIDQRLKGSHDSHSLYEYTQCTGPDTVALVLYHITTPGTWQVHYTSATAISQISFSMVDGENVCNLTRWQAGEGWQVCKYMQLLNIPTGN